MKEWARYYTPQKSVVAMSSSTLLRSARARAGFELESNRGTQCLPVTWARGKTRLAPLLHDQLALRFLILRGDNSSECEGARLLQYNDARA